MIFNESPRRKQINSFVTWGHWFALANIIIAIVISSVYWLASPSPTSLLSAAYLLLTWLGHTAFLTFFGFILVILPMCYKVTNARVLKVSSSIIAALALALLAFDALLFNKTGFHISLQSADLLKSETQGEISAFSWLQWFYLVLLFIIWLMFQLVLANAIHKRIAKFQRIRIGNYVSSFFVFCFVSSHAIHVWADARLYIPVLQQDNMFPLSYPATAKTLMSRAGLLDIQDYRQKQGMQYQPLDNELTYPPNPVYCSIDNTQKVLVLRIADSFEIPESSALTDHGFHFTSRSIQDDYLRSLLFALPSAITSKLNGQVPVSVALPNAFGMNIVLHDALQQLDDPFLQNLSVDIEAFTQALEQATQGLFIATLRAEQAQQLALNLMDHNSHVLIVSKPTEQSEYRLHSNMPLQVGASSTEDLMPTVISQLGCQSEVANYSSGRDLQAPSRNWIVSTQGPYLVMIKDQLITQVSSDGSFEVVDYTTGEKVLMQLDTNLLSRAIKQLDTLSK